MWLFGLDRAGSGKGRVEGTGDFVNKPSCSIKCREIHE